jgi:hypothetical protein
MQVPDDVVVQEDVDGVEVTTVNRPVTVAAVAHTLHPVPPLNRSVNHVNTVPARTGVLAGPDVAQ